MSEAAAIKPKATRRRPDFVRDAIKEIEAVRVLREHIADLAAGDEDVIRDTLEGETDLDGLVAALVASIGEDEAHSEGLKTYEGALALRRKKFDDRAAYKRTLIATALEIAARPTIETDAGTVSLKPVPPKALVTEEADVPAEFWKPTPPKLDRSALLAALKEGRAVPGASLSNGGTTVSIRVR